jgi:O-antigen/teichoic acid export membrane protein
MAQNRPKPPSIAHQAAFSIAGVGVHGVARFCYAIVVARILGLEALASYTSALAVTLLASLVWPTGLGIATAHFVAHQPAHPQQSATLRAAKRSFLWVMMPLAIVILGVMLLGGASLPVAASTAALTIGYSAYIALRSVLMAFHLAYRIAIFEFITAILALGGLAFVVVNSWHNWVLAPLALAYIPFFIFGAVQLNRIRCTERTEVNNRRALFVMSGWNSGAVLAANGLLQISLVAVYLFSPVGNQSAIFAAAVSLAGPATMLAQALAQTLQPRVSAWRSQLEDSGRKVFTKASTGIALGLTLLFALVILFTPGLITLLLGSQYLPSTLCLQILMIGMWAFSISSVLAVAPISARREHTVALAYVLGALSGTVLTSLIWNIGEASVVAALGVSLGYIVAMSAIARLASTSFIHPAQNK